MVMAAIATVMAAGCGSESSVVDRYATAGWPAMHADARNSDTSPVTGSRDLEFSWSRPLGGPVAAYASVAANGQSFVTARAENGCNLFSFQLDTGRKVWCTRMNDGVAASTPIVDTATNVYVGESGAMASYTRNGQLRWRTLVVGTPLSAQFTGDGNLLFITQLGQINVLNPQTGAKVVSSYNLIPPPTFDQQPNAELIPDNQGLDECFLGTAGCPVANTPAIDLASGTFYFTFFGPNSLAADLVAMKYTGGENPSITPEWSTDALPGGTASSPDLSKDGKTVYTTDNNGTLWAIDAATGDTVWSYGIGFNSAGSPSTSDDGLIIPAGAGDGHLLAVQDKGDHAELVWERKDLLQLGVPAQTAGNTGYTVVREGDNGLSLVTFDTRSGETVAQNTLPGAVGFTVGTSVGPNGEVVTPSAIGELFVFK
jgi:outer membrane protein assembly factor BamB